MKSSLKKLRGALRHERKGHGLQKLRAQLDELHQASRDMKDMRDCYDRLLSAAAAAASSVYEFSESLGEMGDCLLEKTALTDDEESVVGGGKMRMSLWSFRHKNDGKVLLMLGKVELELQKLVDSYEMKRRCDEKSYVLKLGPGIELAELREKYTMTS